MRLFMVIAIVIFAMPITGFGWAEGSNILLDPYLMCRKARRLRGKMAEICRHDSALLKEIINGINLGFRECEFEFRNRRWNCTALRKSMRKILMRDTRETGFVNAITSAGATYAVTKACTLGNLIECSCDRSHSRRNGGQPQMVNAVTAAAALERQQMIYENNSAQTKRKRGGSGGGEGGRGGDMVKRKRKLFKNIQFPDGEWEWGGCSDNVNFGFRHSRLFLDAKYRRRSDLRAMIKLHNNRAGRLAIQDSMRLECKCHGLSGSCTVKTCWFKMPPFRELATHLRDKYDHAYKVILRNDGKSFMPENSWMKQPTKYDLVYSDDSADFCAPNVRTGSIGTHGRECNTTSTKFDSCDLLCCSRGFKRLIVTEWVNCRCAFKWCCEVTCEKCLEKREIHTCL